MAIHDQPGLPKIDTRGRGQSPQSRQKRTGKHTVGGPLPLGLETTEDTLDGDWTYTYDADGQLIEAVFASTNPSVPSQDLAYSYDAMGNRITTVINGVTTQYTTNT